MVSVVLLKMPELVIVGWTTRNSPGWMIGEVEQPPVETKSSGRRQRDGAGLPSMVAASWMHQPVTLMGVEPAL